MPLTRNFRDTVRARAEREPAFRKALFQEAVQALLQGETDEGRTALRTYINATVGFDRLGEVLGRSPKSLMRMFGPDGNPTAENLLGVIGALQEETGVHLKIRAVTEAASQKPQRAAPRMTWKKRGRHRLRHRIVPDLRYARQGSTHPASLSCATSSSAATAPATRSPRTSPTFSSSIAACARRRGRCRRARSQWQAPAPF